MLRESVFSNELICGFVFLLTVAIHRPYSFARHNPYDMPVFKPSFTHPFSEAP